VRRAATSGWFHRFASSASRLAGRPLTFALAVMVVVGWAISGQWFGFSDTWQLVINTGTTIITFLMVFLIQNTQSREADAVQLKLDEVIRAIAGAHNALLDLEEMDEADLARLRKHYLSLAKKERERVRNGEPDTGVPDVEPPRSRGS
jgi:low affinity Fe/Cu permease